MKWKTIAFALSGQSTRIVKEPKLLSGDLKTRYESMWQYFSEYEQKPEGVQLVQVTLKKSREGERLIREAINENHKNSIVSKKYDKWGIVRQAGFQVDKKTICRRFSDSGRKAKCINWAGKINLGTSTNDEFFCSELILAAYQNAGLPLTTTLPHWNSQQALSYFFLFPTFLQQVLWRESCFVFILNKNKYFNLF